MEYRTYKSGTFYLGAIFPTARSMIWRLRT